MNTDDRKNMVIGTSDSDLKRTAYAMINKMNIWRYPEDEALALEVEVTSMGRTATVTVTVSAREPRG